MLQKMLKAVGSTSTSTTPASIHVGLRDAQQDLLAVV
jgi:hypothetical protein